MPASPSSKINATSLPNITALRDELDYGNPQLTRCSVFYDDVRGFRKKFITSTGLPGPDLHNWKSPEHHAGLDEMTTGYLDRDGNGALFWPDSSTSANYNKLQYSRDQNRIRRLMKYLFFRLNQQQFRNKRYKNKDKQESVDPQLRGQSVDSQLRGYSIDPQLRGQSIADSQLRAPSIGDPQSRGKSIEDPIDVDAFIEATHNISVLPYDLPSHIQLQKDHFPDIGSSSHRPVQSEESADKVKDTNQSAHNRMQTVKVENPEDEDVFAVPQSPEPSASNIPQNKPISKRKPKPLTPDQAAKRAKPQSRSPKRRNIPPPDTSLSPSSTPRRSSDRQKKPVFKPGFHSIDHLNEFLDGSNAGDAPQVLSNPEEPSNASVADEPVIKTFATMLGTSSLEEATQPHAEHETGQIEAEIILSTALPHRDSSIREHQPKQHADNKRLQEASSQIPLDTSVPAAKTTIDHEPKEQSSVYNADPIEESRATSERLGTPQSKPSAKPNISIIYRFILSRFPIYSYRSLNPTWKLEKTSLAQMIEELGLAADVRGLIFTVEGPSFRAVEEILRDNETGFDAFVRQVKKAIKAMRTNRLDIVIEMEIEAIQGDDMKRDEEFDDDFTI